MKIGKLKKQLREAALSHDKEKESKLRLKFFEKILKRKENKKLFSAKWIF